MMLVTHRGPFRFSVRDDGGFEATRGAGGVVSALLPLVDAGIATRDARGRRTRLVDRGNHRRRRHRCARSRCGDGPRPRSAPARPRSHAPPPALRHRVERDALVPAPRPVRPSPSPTVRRALPHRVGRLRHGEHDLCRDRDRRRPTAGETVLVHDYQLALVPGMVRAARPDLALAPLHPHAVLRPQLDPRAAVRRRRRPVPVDGIGAVRLPHHTVGAGLPGVGAHDARDRGTDHRLVRDTARARPGRARRRLRARGRVGRRRRARRHRRRPQAHLAHRPDRSDEEHRARLPRLRPTSRAARGVA